MADYSKQWVDTATKGDLPWSFDILDEASRIEPGYYLPIICEGYGFIAISKDNHGEIFLAFEDVEDNIKWIPYQKLLKQPHAV